MKSYLCVGGPHAGQKYEAGKRTHFSVPIKTESTAEGFHSKADASSVVETITYIEETFHTHQGPITFWIPLGQTWYETMVLLMEGYELTMAATNEVARYRKMIGDGKTDKLSGQK